MMKFFMGVAIGGLATYSSISYLKANSGQGLGLQEHQMVQAYIHNHKLQKLLKQNIMNGYMQLNKAFLDYGLRQKLDGFDFYGTYFDKDQLNGETLTKAYCIFSPRQQLCGHPNIQHGGVTATIVDQNSGILAMLYSSSMVATADLFVKYVKPVKKGQLYVWSGEIQGRQDRKIFIKSVLKELQTGIVCANGQALMMTVNWQHKAAQVFHLLFKQKNIPSESN